MMCADQAVLFDRDEGEFARAQMVYDEELYSMWGDGVDAACEEWLE